MRLAQLLPLLLLFSGCAGARWVSDLESQPSTENLVHASAPAAAEKTPPPASATAKPVLKETVSQHSPAPPPANDPWQQSLARLRERTDLDPQTKARLLADMEQVEPVYRPMMARTLEAILAPPAANPSPAATAAIPPASAEAEKQRRESAPLRAPLAVPPVAPALPQIRPLGRDYESAALPGAVTPAPAQLPSFSANAGAAIASVALKTPVVNSPAPATIPSATPSPSTTVVTDHAQTPAASAAPESHAASPPAKTEPKPEPPLDYRKELQDAITALQVEIGKLPEKDAARQRMEVEIKLLQLAAGERDAAVKGLDRVDPWLRDYWKHQFHALVVGLDDSGSPVASRRAALALRELRDASSCLATGSTLDVRNLAFCTEVNSFGRFTEFPRSEFQANQEVLLYAEIDNVSVAQTSAGFESSLQGSYQILGPTGQRVADYSFPVETDVCRNRRRDYFIPFRLYLPKKIDPGRYTLQLTVEDLKGKKFGQANIDFSVIATTTAAR